MPKKLTHVPQWKAPQDREIISLRLQTITPLFGGGANAREVDALSPIRPASIRGALRFWWRATAGARFPNAAALFAEEARLWGRDSQPGTVSLAVHLHSVPQHEQYLARPSHRDWPGYALFPFRQQQDGTPPAACLPPGLEFTLVLQFLPKDTQALKEALCAWVRLGGVGARTRRGCGSLGSPPLAIRGSTTKTATPEWALLPTHAILGSPCQDAITAWKTAVEVYAQFRVQPPFARDPRGNPDERGRSKPGRSYWPEPDAIRRIAGTYKHKPVHETPIGFPRADLGLPIIFHYQQDGRLQGREPEDATLEGSEKGFTRFASPVITKAVQVGKQWHPLILLLNAPSVWTKPVVLKHSRGRTRAIAPAEINLGGDFQPVRPLRAESTREALRAFLLRNEGFRHVALEDIQ